MKALIFTITLITAALVAVTGCDNSIVDPINKNLPDEDLPSTPNLANPAPPPSDLVTVDIGGETVEFWPWVGNDLSGTPGIPPA